MSNIFDVNRYYCFNEIVHIAEIHCMTTVDCIKDDGVLCLEGFDGQQLSGEILFEFTHFEVGKFKLNWFDHKWFEKL